MKHFTVNSFSRVAIKFHITKQKKKIYDIDTMDLKSLKRVKTMYLKKKRADSQVPNIYKIGK